MAFGFQSGAWAKGSRLERIYAEKALRVCIEPGYYGISYRDPASGRVSGLDADLVRELSRDLGVEPLFVDSSFASLASDLAIGRCDVSIFPAGPERGEKLRFVPPHLRSELYAVASRSTVKGWEDLDRKGVVVAVAKGAPQESSVRARLRNASLVTVDASLSRIPNQKLDRADVFVTDYPYSQRLVQAGSERLATLLGNGPQRPYAWAVPVGDERWYARIEHFMQEIKRDGRLLTAARRHHLEPLVLLD